MTWRIPILLGLMTLSVTAATNADPVRPRALSFSVSAGKPVGLPGQDSAMPALGVGFSYSLDPAYGLRSDGDDDEVPAELFNAAAYDAGRRDGLAAFARVSLALVHRF